MHSDSDDNDYDDECVQTSSQKTIDSSKTAQTVEKHEKSVHKKRKEGSSLDIFISVLNCTYIHGSIRTQICQNIS